MRGAISDEVLSIVREMVSMNTANVTLPSNAVEAMINRIDHQDKCSVHIGFLSLATTITFVR